MPKQNLIPNLLKHPSGRAYCRWKSHCYYFGKHGTAESEEAFRRFCAELLASGSPPLNSPSLTVAELSERYLEHARRIYKAEQVAKIEDLIALTVGLYGSLKAADFGPSKLRTIRQKFLEREYANSTVNQRVNWLAGMFRWGVSWELVPASVSHALESVERLIDDSEEVEPAPEDAIVKALAHMTLNARTMCEVILLTAMRPDEICRLRMVEVQRDKPISGIWMFSPTEHKTAHHGITKEILIGPKAQAILLPWIGARQPHEYIFQPKDSLLWKPKRTRKRQIRERYHTPEFCKAVYRACELAGCEHWSPGQLRHNAASRLEDEFGPDIARKILGHRTLTTTRRYIRDDLRKAAEAMKKTG